MACGEAFANTQHFRRHSSWESILVERWQGACELPRLGQGTGTRREDGLRAGGHSPGPGSSRGDVPPLPGLPQPPGPLWRVPVAAAGRRGAPGAGPRRPRLHQLPALPPPLRVLRLRAGGRGCGSLRGGRVAPAHPWLVLGRPGPLPRARPEPQPRAQAHVF